MDSGENQLQKKLDDLENQLNKLTNQQQYMAFSYNHCIRCHALAKCDTIKVTYTKNNQTVHQKLLICLCCKKALL